MRHNIRMTSPPSSSGQESSGQESVEPIEGEVVSSVPVRGIQFYLQRWRELGTNLDQSVEKAGRRFFAYIEEPEEEHAKRLRDRWVRRRLRMVRLTVEPRRFEPENSYPFTREEAELLRPIIRRYAVRFAATRRVGPRAQANLKRVWKVLVLGVIPVAVVYLGFSRFFGLSLTELAAALLAAGAWTAVVMLVVSMFKAGISPGMALFSLVFYVASAFGVAFLESFWQAPRPFGDDDFNLWLVFATGLVLIIVALGTLVVFVALQVGLRNRVVLPRRSRLVDEMVPSQIAVVNLNRVVEFLVKHRNSHLQLSGRRALVRELRSLRLIMLFRIRHSRSPGGRKSRHRTEIEVYHHRSLAFFDHVYRDILKVTTRQEYEAIIERLRVVILALAEGDWDLLPDPLPIGRAQRFRRFATRLAAPVVLLAIAVAFPYLPFVELDPTADTAIRVALITSALLALVPGGESRLRG